MGQVVLKRVLTYRSYLKYGKYGKYRIQRLLNLKRDAEMIRGYFKLSSIDFIPELLTELGITEEYRIVKPGTDKIMYKHFLENGTHRVRKPMKAKDKNSIDYVHTYVISRDKNRRRNQGH